MPQSYRSDIDGLRALAVLAVLFYHAKFSFAAGGYIGVDIFFVISGFLLARLAISDANFSYLEFYERRIRRIVPLLLVVVAFSSVVGWFLMTPDDLRRLGQSVFASLIFSNNLLLAITNGYFEPVVDLKPLMHTWSLAVEEQFYLIFPILFFITKRFEKTSLLLLIGLASFLVYEFMGTNDLFGYFYLPFGRVWEFSVGIIAATVYDHGPIKQIRSNAVISGSVTFGGLLLILGSILYLTDKNATTALAFVMPTLGAFLLILFGSRSNPVSLVLSISPLVWLGLISYGIYLWHQPLFSFWRIYNLDSPNTFEYLSLITISIVLASVSLHTIERPFRNRQTMKISKFCFFVVPSFIVLAVAGVGAHLANGFIDRLPENARETLNIRESQWSLLSRNCVRPIKNFPNIDACFIHDADEEISANNKAIMIYGDSHAGAMIEPLYNSAVEANKTLIYLKNGYCHVIATLVPKNADAKHQKQCRESLLAIQDWTKSQPRQIEVLVAIRWFLQGYPYSWIEEPPYFDNGANGIEAHPGVEVFAINKITGDMSSEFIPKKEAIADFIDYLATWGESVTVIGPVPEVGWDVGDYLFMSLLRDGRKPDSISTSFDRYLTRNKFYTGIFSNLAEKRRNIWFVDPSKIFCNQASFENRCVASIDEEIFYFDDDHLSYLGASKLMDYIINSTPIFNLKFRDD